MECERDGRQSFRFTDFEDKIQSITAGPKKGAMRQRSVMCVACYKTDEGRREVKQRPLYKPEDREGVIQQLLPLPLSLHAFHGVDGGRA